MTTVQKIHNDFFTASDCLLEELRNQKLPNKKGVRLANLGFKNTKEAKDSLKLLSAVQSNKKISEWIEYYQCKYPLYKFITEEQVERICSKYNLNFAPIEFYKGEVPEKNLAEIERFKIDNCDVGNMKIRVLTAWNTPKLDDLSFLFTRIGGHVIHSIIGEKWIDSDRFYWHPDRLFGIYLGNRLTYIGKYKIRPNTLHICAPKKDFVNIIFPTFINPPDPVVLQPVKGGYLIVSAWGDEANDDDVINPKMN